MGSILGSNHILLGYFYKHCVIALAYFSGRIKCRLKGLWVGVYVFLLVGSRKLSCTKDTRIFWRRLYVELAQLWVVLMMSSSVGPCQLVESSLLSWQQLGLFVDFNGSPLANNSIGYTQSWNWKVCMKEMASWDCLPYYLETFSGSASYILGSFHCTKFPYSSSNAPQF